MKYIDFLALIANLALAAYGKGLIAGPPPSEAGRSASPVALHDAAHVTVSLPSTH